jgi:hypothetical protein
MTFLVRINERPYAVADTSLAEIESRVLDAVRAGGGFIDLKDDAAQLVRVLVTSATPIRIEPAPGPVQASDFDLAPDISYLDLDL